ncbi:NF041680 family putative transposase [Moorena sp. SIO3I6]|uniref:NF041680 family putative transposase n=1 Tax=Moorena sp. SIO3I6 TaxID=2607831 RepID=UPI0013F85112|nr:NF041680 family putative transposase [Moorena sp. SIO3I6]NEP22935.1 transposase [Moorena sp. SIO3I6]
MNTSISRLQQFRIDSYNLLGRASDATMDLIDAVLTTRTANSLADFSLSPVFRREWSSTYKSLQDCRPLRQKLMKRYLEEVGKDTDESSYLMVAIDHTSSPRVDSPTLKDRGYHHSPSAEKKVTTGHSYSTIAWIPEEKGSWALPLRHERITSFETPISKAAWQLKQVAKNSKQPILALLDSEYGNASWVNTTKDIEADCLIRIRSNCCLYGLPGKYSGRGRPKKHGDKFKLNDENTWWSAKETIEVNDPKLGLIRIRKWSKLHFRNSSSVSMELILVERLKPNKQGILQKPLWLVFIGQKRPTLEMIWNKYLRRFAVDHWYRFIKQRLHWTLPSLSTPQQCERWSDLMPLMTWQLWLARDIVKEHHLPLKLP